MNRINGRRIDDISDVWCLRLKTKVLPRRRTFFRACESGLLVFERKKVFFCGIQQKKVKKVLPRDPAKEGSAGSSAGSSGRTFSSADARAFLRKNLRNLLPQATSPSRGRTCGAFFCRLPVLLAEEPAEPSSADHVLLYIGFFLENYV